MPVHRMRFGDMVQLALQEMLQLYEQQQILLQEQEQEQEQKEADWPGAQKVQPAEDAPAKVRLCIFPQAAALWVGRPEQRCRSRTAAGRGATCLHRGHRAWLLLW
eukprot:COSAG05_NODE_9295_length_634_cov_0.852336_2_plen_105_part_00